MLGYSIGVIYILSGWLLVLILFEGFVVFFCGIILEYLKSKQSYAKNILSKDEYSLYKIKIGKQKNLVSFLGVSLVLLLLFLCKYLNAFIKLENNIVTWFGGSGNIGFATLLAPLGLSYFSLVSISYIVDVKRGKYHAERNIFKVITFICFFPTLFEGPIGRYDRLKSSLLEGDTNPSEENYIDGLLRIMFGLLKKL
jgi:alginate O-acetyltransferase complex protein AlgI